MKGSKRVFAKGILLCFISICFIFLGATPLFANDYGYKLVATYQGANGVEFRSYASGYDEKKLEWLYQEFVKNTIGEEITHLSHVSFYPDAPKGQSSVAGRWFGSWVYDRTLKRYVLSDDCYIEIYVARTFDANDDRLRDYVEGNLINTLSHEYGHHFTYYYLNKKEGIINDPLKSRYYQIRNLSQYKELNNGFHQWSIAEILAEDYVQLFGTPSLAQYSAYKAYPQENKHIPLAWDVPGLYEYFVNLSGLKGKQDHEAPSDTQLKLMRIEGDTLFFQWNKSSDNSMEPLTYTIYAETSVETPTSISSTRYPMDYLESSEGYTSSLNINWLKRDTNDKVMVRLIVMDPAGNAISRNISIDRNNPQASISYTFPGKRITGSDRYQTSAAISKEAFPYGSSYAILVTGENFPDALAASPLAAKYNAPILLTNSKSLNPYTKEEIDRLGVKNVIIVGGTGAVSQGIEDVLEKSGINVRRIAGTSRYDTAIAIAKELGDFHRIFVCTGENFPDALSAASLAASEKIPILLTPGNDLPPGFDEFIQDKSITESYVVGGTGVISDQVLAKLPQAKRLSGVDRYHTNLTLLREFDSVVNENTVYLVTGLNYPDALSGSVLAGINKNPILLVGSADPTAIKGYLRTYGLTDQSAQVIGGSGVISEELLKRIFK